MIQQNEQILPTCHLKSNRNHFSSCKPFISVSGVCVKTVGMFAVCYILTEPDNAKWHQKLMNAENGNNLRTYRQYKSAFKTEHYVKCYMDTGHMRVLARFRGCNLLLATET